MTDQGFPKGGSNSKDGGVNLLLFSKNCMEMKEMKEIGHSSLPLDPPLEEWRKQLAYINCCFTTN